MILKANLSVFRRYSRLSIDRHSVRDFKTENPVNSVLISKKKQPCMMCVEPPNFMLLGNQRQLKYCDLSAAKFSECNTINSEMQRKRNCRPFPNVTSIHFCANRKYSFRWGRIKKYYPKTNKFGFVSNQFTPRNES